MSEIPRRARLAREHRNKKAARLFVTAAIVLVILGVAGLVISRARGVVIERLVQVAPVQEGVLEKTEPVTGLLLHQATVLRTPVPGQVDFLVPEGERVRVGTEIARVKTNRGTTSQEQVEISLKTPGSGVVCYHPDGLEGLATPGILEQLAPAQIEGLTPRTVDVRREETIEAGEPVARVIDNLGPTLIYVQINPKLFEKPLALKGKIGIEVGNESASYQKAQIVGLKNAGQKAQVVLALPAFQQELLDMRRVDIRLVIRRFVGVVVPAGALVRKDGEDGVYAVRKGVVHWREIQVEGRLADKVTVDGIPPGTRIVLNPGLTAEGDMVE